MLHVPSGSVAWKRCGSPVSWACATTSALAADVDIDELLKQDEAALREKKKRLKALQSALEESRAATSKAQAAAAASLDSGDLTRADLVRVFALSKGERADLLPVAPRASAKTGDSTAQGVEQSDDAHHDQA